MATKKTTKPTTTKSKKTTKTTTAKSGKSCCRATEHAQDMCKLTDYDIISDILSSQKGLIKLYGTALCEVASEDLRTVVTQKMTECAEDQYDAFLYMNERGMYKTEPAPVSKIKQACDKFGKSMKK